MSLENTLHDVGNTQWEKFVIALAYFSGMLMGYLLGSGLLI